MEMNIGEIKQMKAECEYRITAILREFEEKTGCNVNNICLHIAGSCEVGPSIVTAAMNVTV